MEQYHDPEKQSRNVNFLYAALADTKSAAVWAEKTRTQFFEDLRVIRGTIHIYGELIQGRWLKKSNAKRKKHLRQLRPNITQTENAFMDTIINEFDLDESEQYRDTFLLPYLNLESLAQDGWRLIRLLHYRTHHHPEEWVTFDNRQILGAWIVGVYDEKYVFDGCVKMIGKDYGKLIQFDKDKVHCGECYGAPRGLMILELQTKLVRFLRDLTASLLGGIEDTRSEDLSSGSPISALQPPSGSPQPGECSRMSFAMTYYNEPFSAPPTFDLQTIDQLVEIATEKETEAQDNLWLLQTDPSYFHSIASHWTEHNWATVSGSRQTRVSMTRDVAVMVIIHSVRRAETWQSIVDELSHVRREYITHRDNIKIGKPLPEQYGRSLGAALRRMTEVLAAKGGELLDLAYIAPGLKSKWQYVTKPSEPGQIFMLPKDGSALDNKTVYDSDRIHWYVKGLAEGAVREETPDLGIVLRALDVYLATCKKAEGEKIDFITYDRITELAAISRIIWAIRLHRPTLNHRYTRLEEVITFRDSRMTRLRRVSLSKKSYLDGLLEVGIAKMFDSLDRYRMPSGPKDLQWLNRADSARRAVSEVWSMARKNYRLLYQTIGADPLDFEDRILWLSHHDSPAYHATVTHERKEILARIAQQSMSKELINGSYEATIPHTAAHEETPPRRKKQSLGKSRLTTVPHEDENKQDMTSPEDQIRTLPPLPLPKKSKSLSTLRLLFPTTKSDLKGTIQWIEFIAMMSEMGFEAEHRGGSEWTFRSFGDITGDRTEMAGDKEHKEQGKRSTVIHQPHPDTKMGPVQLQWIGKRLWRRFGWCRERFEGL